MTPTATRALGAVAAVAFIVPAGFVAWGVLGTVVCVVHAFLRTVGAA